MKNKINLLKTSIGVGIIALALVVLGSPALSHAASYAYVNQTGEVRSVEASSPQIAIDTAFGRAFHSGVMLLNTISNNDVVGDQVTGF